MSVVRTFGFALAGMTAAAISSAVPALADEAYICDGGRLVYVKPGELEHLKRTDPCIAGYYGLEVGKASETAKPAVETMGPSIPEGGAEKGLALEREARAQLNPVETASTTTAKASKPKKAIVAAPADFRNVVIINAAPGAGTIFRHER